MKSKRSRNCANKDCINKCQSSWNGKFNWIKQWNFGYENSMNSNFLLWLCNDFQTSLRFHLTSSNKCRPSSMIFHFFQPMIQWFRQKWQQSSQRMLKIRADDHLDRKMFDHRRNPVDSANDSLEINR